MTTETKQYKVGDRVWFAHYGTTQVDKPCPVCYGTKHATLILGNSDKVLLDCDFCAVGFPKQSRGYIHDYELVAKAEPLVITSIEAHIDKVGQSIRCYSGGHFYPLEDLFDTKEEAVARCDEKIQQSMTDNATRASNLKHVQYKSYTWNAGYHLKQAERYAKEAEQHKQKAVLCEAKAK